jgi:hypothetical protein
MIAEGQRNLVDYKVRTASVCERQNREPQGRILLVVARDVDVETTRIKFHYPIEERFAPVRFSLIFGLEKGTSLFCLRANGGTSREAHHCRC